MCGIVGTTHPQECSPDLLAEMTACLAHRGPDATGAWRDERLALAHRRLAILDLSERGAQPMSLPEKGLVAVYNGEVYNHRDLRRRISPDCPWRSATDTETLLRLFEFEGPEFISLCNGMFALAIYDPAEARLHLYRDRLGIKPLYYTASEGRLAFASELRPLLKLPWVRRGIDSHALSNYILFNYVPHPETIVAGVRQLPPGHRLEYDFATGEFAIRRWWTLPTPPAAITHPTRDRAEAVEELEELLTDAVRARTLSDVPLGCFLSGGIDSSLVAALLQKVSSGPVKTFTIGFREKDFNEADHAREVARHLGTEHHELTATAEDCLPLVEQMPALCDEPFADASFLPTVLLSRLTRDHVTVALSGDGGDELFLGYDRYQWLLTVKSRMQFVPGAVRRKVAAWLANRPNYRHQTIGRGLLYRTHRELYGHVFIGWNAELANQIRGDRYDFNDHPFHALYDDASGTNERSGPSLDARAGYADLRHYLPDDILVKGDRASMSASLEMRVPLLDYRVAEMAMGLPPAWRNAREPKAMLREILFRHVPRELIERPKRGFAVPLRDWFRGPLRDLLHDTLAHDALARDGFLNADVAQRLMAEHDSGSYNRERQLWSMLVFQLWRNQVLV
ncbi:MAG: asparagine synthase (glutamine-hydrolyzing) [Sumerlaeia bacterium]